MLSQKTNLIGRLEYRVVQGKESRRFLIGIDDTDNLESRGTGYHARQLGSRLAALGLGEVKGITRH